MTRVVVTHCRERFSKPAFLVRVEVRSRCEHAMVVCRRGPYLMQGAFRHKVLVAHSVPEWTTDSTGVGSPVEHRAYNFHFAGPGVTMFADVTVEAQCAVVDSLTHPLL